MVKPNIIRIKVMGGVVRRTGIFISVPFAYPIHPPSSPVGVRLADGLTTGGRTN